MTTEAERRKLETAAIRPPRRQEKRVKEKDRPGFGVADSPFRGYISGASQEDHIAVYPPSTGRLTPVTYAEFFEARNRVAVSSSPSSP